MPVDRPQPTERMPGSRFNQSPEMADYIATLKDVEVGDHDRKAFVQSSLTRTAAFQRRLREFLKINGMTDQVDGIGEPTIAPLIVLRCTPEAAKLIAELPEVEDVIRDTNVFEMLPHC